MENKHMKTLLVFNIHSFIDLVTNSSSELFVIETDLKIYAFKELLEELSKKYNKDLEEGMINNENGWFKPIRVESLWEDIFKLPKVAIKSYNEPELWEEFSYNHNLRLYNIYRPIDLWLNDNLKSLSQEWNNIMRKNSQRDIPTHYMISVTQGDILLYSGSDNSIPWGFQEYLEEKLPSYVRYHLGYNSLLKRSNINMRIREFPENNYKAFFINGKTLHMTYDSNKEIEELEYPEFLDVAINSWCSAGCSYCYTSATKKGTHFKNVPEKINNYFGSMTLNERPFQVALGGAGEPTAHPQLESILKAFKNLQIVPNYTTNGLHLTDEVLRITKQYCGGVAYSLHPHLYKKWDNVVNELHNADIKTNLHIVISNSESFKMLDYALENYLKLVDYIVLLPYRPVGRATADIEIGYDTLTNYLNKLSNSGNINKIAFGAYFEDYLRDNIDKYPVSLYREGTFSKYLIMDDDMKLYNNSFDMLEVK